MNADLPADPGTKQPPERRQDPGGESRLRKEILVETLESLDSVGEQDPPGTLHLLNRYKQGDSGAGEELAVRYDNRLRRYVRVRMNGRLRQVMDSQEAVQDAFAELLGNLPQFEYRGKDSLYAYLRTIAENKLRQAVRRTERRGAQKGEDAEELLTLVPDDEQGPEDQASYREVQAILDDVASQLSEKRRNVILHRFYLEGSWKEVAEALNFPTAHAAEQAYYLAKKELVSRAEPRLRDWLKGS